MVGGALKNPPVIQENVMNKECIVKVNMIDITNILNDKIRILDKDCLLPPTKTAHDRGIGGSESMKVSQVEDYLDQVLRNHRVIKSCMRACGTRMRICRNYERGKSRAKCHKKFTNKSRRLKELVSMRYPQCFRLASMLQA